MEAILKGAIPLEIRCSENEIASHNPPVYYVSMSRYSYLHFLDDEPLNYLKLGAMETIDTCWFEHASVSLPPYLPVGVLYDLFFSKNTSTGVLNPWKISIHFLGNQDASFNFSSSKCSKIFDHTVKQALFLLSGSMAHFFTLKLEDKKDLLSIAMKMDIDRFIQLRKDILPPEEKLKSIPIRVFVQDLHSDSSEKNNWLVFRQRSINEFGMSVMDAIRLVYPEIVVDLYDVYIQGVFISPHATIFELWKLFMHADFFLYIVLKIVSVEQICGMDKNSRK